MTYFESAYTVIGGLGIFFLGLVFLSEALQSSGRDTIRRILSKVTKNRVMAVGAGIGITAFVQSSSISTVMTVSLVNAGLLELRQGLAVILGANVGTTITGWIISIKVGSYGLLFVGAGILPMLASNRTAIKATGKTLVALGLIFIGLEFMADAFRPLRTDEAFISYLTVFDAQTLGSLLACVAMGCILTMIVQSSSAMLGITITLASTGIIGFDTAVGLIIGENIGTTITAQLAVIGANTSAKRAARGHAIFNILGAILMVSIFPYYVDFIDLIIGGEADFTNANGDHPNIALHIATAHTMFNVVNVLVWMPLLGYLHTFVCWLVPMKGEKEIPKLKYLGNASRLSPEVSLQQASMELGNLVNITSELLGETKEYLQGEKHDRKLFQHISHLEEITDNIEQEMITFITAVQTNQLSKEQSTRAYSYVRMADEIESIADCLQSMAIYRSRLFEKNETLSGDAWADLLRYFDDISQYFSDIGAVRNRVRNGAEVKKLLDHSLHLSKDADRLRDRHLERLRDGSCNLITAQTFSDIIISLRRIKNHSVNTLETIVI